MSASAPEARLTFLDKRGALGSVETLAKWLKNNPRLTLEVVDSGGRRWTLSGKDYEAGIMEPADLRALLKRL